MEAGITDAWTGPDSITSPSRSLNDPGVMGSSRYAEHLTNSTPYISTCPPWAISIRIKASRSLETWPLSFVVTHGEQLEG
jgi:hypothetical protein